MFTSLFLAWRRGKHSPWMISVIFMLRLDFGAGWSFTSLPLGRRVKVWGACSHSYVPVPLSLQLCGFIVRDPTCSHHLPLSDPLQSQKRGVLVTVLSSSEMLFIIIFERPRRSREIIVIPGLKTETQMKGDGSSPNARDTSQGSCFGLCSHNILATEARLYCWISEGNRKDDYKMKACLPDTNILVISTD